MQQRWVVDAFACFERLKDIQSQFKETFGFEVAPNALLHYNPTTSQGEQLAKKLKERFVERRARFLKEVDEPPIFNLAVRGWRYEREWQAAKSPDIRLKISETAAKDRGGLFTNKRDITSDGKQVAVIGIEVVPPTMAIDHGAGPGRADTGKEDPA